MHTAFRKLKSAIIAFRLSALSFLSALGWSGSVTAIATALFGLTAGTPAAYALPSTHAAGDGDPTIATPPKHPAVPVGSTGSGAGTTQPPTTSSPATQTGTSPAAAARAKAYADAAAAAQTADTSAQAVVDAANQVLAEAKTLADHADAQLKAALAGTVLTGGIVGITIPAAQGSKAAADDRLAKAQTAANHAATAKAAADTVVARASGLGKSSAGTGALGSPAPTGTPEKSCADAAAAAAASAQTAVDAANGVVSVAQGIADKADALLAAAVAEAVATAGVMSPAVPGATAAQKAAHDMLDKAHVTANLAVAAKADADAAAAKTAGLLDLPQDKGPRTGTTAPATTPNPAGAGGAAHPPAPTTTAPTSTGSSATPSTSAVTPPTSGIEAAAAAADQTSGLGAPELHDFPQVAGVIRKSYNDSQREAAEALSTDYTSSLSPEEVMTQLGRVLTDTGWSETSRNDSGDAAAFTQYIGRTWTRLSQTADIRITQTKANGCTIYVALKVEHIGILGATAATLTAVDPGIESAGGSPNDQGDHDPSNLPRIARSLRKSFASSGSASSELQETAVYRVKVSMTQAEGFYVNRLSQQGDWEITERRETGNLDVGSHQIILFMKLVRSTVEIQLDEEVPGAVTTVTIRSIVRPARDPRV